MDSLILNQNYINKEKAHLLWEYHFLNMLLDSAYFHFSYYFIPCECFWVALWLLL